ncbi:MAG: hypothetical protein ACYSQZ_04120, partial [Planctomycetota bacterium]
MADANGSIEIEVSINGAEAEAGLAKIGEALKDTSISKQGSKDLDKLGQSAADIKGLDTLKDQTGELDSSLK